MGLRSTLKHGKILPPKSVKAARDRRQQIARELARIASQLQDPEKTRFANGEDLAAWKKRAVMARSYLQEEERQLDAWIAQHLAGGSSPRTAEAFALLQEARDLLLVLRDEVDLDPDEEEVISRLDLFMRKSEAT